MRTSRLTKRAESHLLGFLRTKPVSVVRRRPFLLPAALFVALSGSVALSATWVLNANRALAEEAPAPADPAASDAAGKSDAGLKDADAAKKEAERKAIEAKAIQLIQEASEAGAKDQPGLKKKAKADAGARREAKARAARKAREEAPVDQGAIDQGPGGWDDWRRWERRPDGWSGYPWAWGWYPWYGFPQTYYDRKDYPPPITHVPRLGLQYNYPFAYQMGIRVPDDSSPLDHPPNMGPFVGVVQAAKEQLRAEEEAAQAAAQVKGGSIELLKQGKYKEAGQMLAGAFEVSTDPTYPLLLTEVFFALDEPAHAESLLRYALRSPKAVAALPKDVAKHFPTAADFDAKLQSLVAAGRSPLLAGYLLAHSRSPEQGIELLGKLSSGSPEDKAAGVLYRHYLKKVLEK